jgi:mRNA interferase MazF
MQNKDFDGWNIIKKNLDCKNNYLPINEREIWWCSIGLNVGDEENGKNEKFERPVLIMKKFNNKIAFALPLTSNGKGNKFYFKITFNNIESYLILSQLRLVSVKRLRRFVGKINSGQFNKAKLFLLDLLR